MHSKFIGLHSLFVVGTLTVAGGAVHAEQFMLPAVTCQSVLGSQAADINHLDILVTNTNTAPRQVVCAIPRTATHTTFIIHGANSNSSSTTCVLNTFRADGTSSSLQNFTESAPTNAVRNWEHIVSLVGSGAGASDYVYLRCELPGSERGILRGITYR